MKEPRHGLPPCDHDECPPTRCARLAGDFSPSPVRLLPDAPIDLGRLINSLPPDVNKKLSLHDLKRVADAYNTGACPNCYGGFQRPCQWCGDTGVVTVKPNSN